MTAAEAAIGAAAQSSSADHWRWRTFRWPAVRAFLMSTVVYPVSGIALLLALWWLGGWAIENNADVSSFAGVRGAGRPDRVRRSLGRDPSEPLPHRHGIAVGGGHRRAGGSRDRPVGVAARDHLRAVSVPAHDQPAGLDAGGGARVRDLGRGHCVPDRVAAVGPVLFSTAQGVRRIDPLWFKVAKNLGADVAQLLRRVILPAIGQDIFAGVRLAVGVAWIVH